MPGPEGAPGALVGGAALWIVDGKAPEVTAAVWDYVKYLVSPHSQSQWAAGTGYVPVRSAALELEPLATTYAEDPRFKVAYDQLLAAADRPSSTGPILGPQREVRNVAAQMIARVFTGADVATTLAEGAAQANALIADYAARN
jgi:sn-glycerol 3-phosphate transport system substrate-binding protein